MKRYLLSIVAVMLMHSAPPAKAADSCPNLTLTYVTATSPPVVYGNTVQFWATGYNNVAEAWLDGSIHLVAVDWFAPPGFFSALMAATVPYGSHTLRSAFDSCTVNFVVAPPPPPPLLPPAPHLTATGEFLDWNEVSNATSYDIFFDGVFVTSTSATAFLASLPDCEVVGAKVRGCNAYGCGDFSNLVGVDGTPPGQPHCNDQ
jgi:hypothetical protein